MPNYTTPASYKPGLLPRRTEFGKLQGVPAFKEAIKVLSKSEQRDLIPKVQGLKQYVGFIFNQDGIGSCAGESTNQGLSIVRMYSGQKFVKFNPWFTYGRPAAYGYPAGTSRGKDEGSTIDDNVKDLMEIGACPATVYPRYDENGRVIHHWNSTPPKEAYDAAAKYKLLEVFDISTVDEMRTALLYGMPVIYGSDGHAKCYVKCLDMETGLYANSWDSDWGDEGFGKERFSNVWIQYGAFAFRVASDSDSLPLPQ
jgi:hypothetical protein